MKKHDVVRNFQEISPVTAIDGALVRELFHPKNSRATFMSLAFGELKPGQAASFHWHPQAEEYYFVLSGQGHIQIGTQKFRIKAGDAIFIPAKQTHGLICDNRLIDHNRPETLKVLAVECPPYSDEGTSYPK